MSRGLRQRLVVSILLLESENGRVGLLQFRENLLAMLDLHQRWLQGLDSVEDLLSQMVVGNNKESFLKHVVAKLVVDKLLNNEAYSVL